MKISYIRRSAFATNSSSVHTPIVWTKKKPLDYLVDECRFWWSPFVASSEKAKRQYLGAALCKGLEMSGIARGLAFDIAKAWTGEEVNREYEFDPIPLIPKTFDGKMPHRQFFDDLLRWYLRSDVAIVGGNDNDEQAATAWEGYGDRATVLHTGDKVPIEMEGPLFCSPKCRRDIHGFYTLFNSRDGTKVRVSFDPKCDMRKSTAPELVDLKITNYCSKGCDYCYQSSSTAGTHADIMEIEDVLEALTALEVFEVALGGGEPTTHPSFVDILKICSQKGILPSFSTGTLKWLYNTEIVNAVAKHCGGVGVSVSSYHDVRKVKTQFLRSRLEDKLTLLVVLHPRLTLLDDADDVVSIAKAAQELYDVPVTFLGFKAAGRAKDLQNEKVAIDWKLLHDMNLRVSIDTVAAEQYREELQNLGVARWSIGEKEGSHSMYIDAVKGEMGPSSFAPESERIFLPCGATEEVATRIREAFAGWPYEKTGGAVTEELC